MPNHLSVLGIIHTAISILALFVAFYALYRDGKIISMSGAGKLYILLTALTCLTGFPIMKTGHFTGAHGLGLTVLILLPLGVYAPSFRVLGKAGEYIQLIIMSTTLFLSFIPAIVETLTRLPISKPLAIGPDDQLVKMGLMTLVVLYILGVIYQLVKLRSKKKSIQTPDSTINFG